LCRFPVASLDSRVEAMAEPMAAAIRAEQPSWRVEQGLCPQCFDLYDARDALPRALDALRCVDESLEEARSEI
jgi:hypothetical protein